MARQSRRVCHLVGLLLLICTATALRCPDGAASPGREVVCYTSTRELDLLENALCSCTTLVHQGHDLQSLDASEWKNVYSEAKEANPGIKFILSISDQYELLRSSATTRREAATQLTEIVKGVDGVELNVTIGSKERLVSFVKSLKDELVNKSLERMILLALPTKPEDLAKQFELKDLSKYVDLFTVATHYLRDNDEANLTFHPSRLMGLFDMSNTDSLVDLINGMGAPKKKILISAPTSAYHFTLKKAEENTPRSATEGEKPNSIDRKKMCDMINDGEWTIERDEDLTAPYAFKNTSWIAFEDETSLKIKGKYVILRELAGLALRDVENDVKNDCGESLARVVHQSFTEMKRKTREVVLSSLEKDLQGTEIAYPSHVRSSDFRIVRVIDTAGKIRAVRENTQTAFACSRQGYFVHPKSCNRFYRCVKFNQEVDDYSVFEFDCPAGLAFDERTEVCVWPGSLSQGSACPGSSEIEPVPRSRFRCPDHPGFYADPQNCRWFFACYDLGGPEMVPFEFRCPFGLVFDEQKLTCEWPWKVPNCNGPGHGGQHSAYHYGGSYGGHAEILPQEGIIGQEGLIGQIRYDGQNTGGVGVDYDGQIHSAVGLGATNDGQSYNIAGTGTGNGGHDYNFPGADEVRTNHDGQYNSAGEGLEGQSYNAAGSLGQYDGQIHTAGGAIGSGGFDDQTYNSHAGKGVGFDGQSYSGGDDSGARYNGQTYNAAGAAGVGLGPNKQTYDGPSHNPVGYSGTGENSYRPIYNTDINTGSNHDEQTYDARPQAGLNYNEQTYKGAKPVNGFAYGGNRYDGQNYNGWDNSGQGINYGHVPIAGNGPFYNGAGVDCDDKNYNNGVAGGAGVGKGVNDHNRFDGQNVNKEVTFNTADYDNHHGSAATGTYNGQTTFNTESDGRTTQFHLTSSGTPHEINNLAGDTRVPTVYTTGSVKIGESALSTGHPSGGTNEYLSGTTSGYAGATSQNVAGRTTVYADLPTGDTGGVTNDNAGINTFGGQTDASRDVTSQNQLITDGRFGTNFASVTNDLRNTEFTRVPQPQNTNFNALDTKSPTNYYNNNLNTGLSTTGFTNTIEDQNSIGFIETGQPTVYNSSYSANSGYPTSTIIPFNDYQNTFAGSDSTATPFNSMGLTSTEHFGTQYTNQAAKSFAPQGPIGNGFTLNGKTQNTQSLNTGTNVYDNSRINSASVTPPFNRDGQFNTGPVIFGSTFGRAPAGVTDFRGSAINTAGYNTNADLTNTYGNSDIIGSSITSANNDIVKTSGMTEFPDDYQNNKNTAFRTDNFNNQGTVTNQNSLISTDFTRIPIQNPVTPASPTQNFNSQGVIPPNNNIIRPAVELDNSGLFGTNFDGSTTPVAPKSGYVPSTTLNPLPNTYRTNEYYDNGGRGTIRYNNGIITNKVPGNDIQDYRTSSYTSIPSSFIINAGNEDNLQSTVQKYDSTNTQKLDQGVYTKEGFTKTGPTKTGITTAQVGGSGSYVIGTGIPRAKPNPQLIGPNAFAGNFDTPGSQANFGSTGTTNFNARESATKFGNTGTTNFNVGNGLTNFGTVGTTNFNAGGNNFGSAGATDFNGRGGTTNFGTTNFNTRDKTNFGETATTAEFGTSQLSIDLNTASGARTNSESYSYPKPLVQLEIKGISTTPGITQTNFFDSTTKSSKLDDQSYINQNSLIPNIQNDRGTTISPVAYTTSQLENFRTTVYQAAKLPQTISTVKPIFDNGYRTVVSSTSVPTIASTIRQTYQPNDLSTNSKTYLDVGVSFGQGNDYLSGNTDYSDYTANIDQGNFGQRVTGQSSINTIDANQNSELITSTQFDAKTGVGGTAQTNRFGTNQATILRNGVTIPTQVYLPSSTIAPEVGVTFGTPILAADFSQQGQSSRSLTNSNSINRNAAGFASRGSSNRVLSNQSSGIFTPQSLSGGNLVNQSPAGLNNIQGSNDGILRNQAFASAVSQGSSENFRNNQASANFAYRGSSNRLLNNQASGDFASRGSINRVASNRGSAAFASQGSKSGLSNGQISPNTFSNQNQGFNGQTRTLIGSNVVTSIGGAGFNNDVIRQNIPLNGGSNSFARIQQSTTSQPEITTYSGTFSRTRSRAGANLLDTRNGNKKVIVKLSDLHPLIIGKLGAECTCKADPFSIFRGPNRQTLPVYSQNRGPVDLANYDESDIYIDVDGNKENEKEIEFLKNIPSNRLIKTSDSGFNDTLDDRGIVVTSRGNPVSSTYLPPTTARPPSTTYLPPARTSSITYLSPVKASLSTYLPPGKTSSTTYLPPTRVTNEYLPPSEKEDLAPVFRENQAQNKLIRTQSYQPLLIRVEENNRNARVSQVRERSGKALFDKPVGSKNELRDSSIPFDRYGSAGLRNNDESLQREPDCARPGLFRHPKFCNKFYACHWDSWKKRYTLHVFNCPVHLAFDSSAGACNYPTKGPACQDNKLLV